jgi:hypothetical protein
LEQKIDEADITKNVVVALNITQAIVIAPDIAQSNVVKPRQQKIWILMNFLFLDTKSGF